MKPMEPIVLKARVNASPETIWATLTADQAFSRLFHRGFGPVPGVARTELADPHSGPVTGNYHVAHLVHRLPFGVVRAAGKTKEQFEDVSPPTEGKSARLAYTVTGYPPPFHAFVEAGHGSFELEPDNGSTLVTFSYIFDPKNHGLLTAATSRLLRLAMKVWKSNMARALEQLSMLSESAEKARYAVNAPHGTEERRPS